MNSKQRRVQRRLFPYKIPYKWDMREEILEWLNTNHISSKLQYDNNSYQDVIMFCQEIDVVAFKLRF